MKRRKNQAGTQAPPPQSRALLAAACVAIWALIVLRHAGAGVPWPAQAAKWLEAPWAILPDPGILLCHLGRMAAVAAFSSTLMGTGLCALRGLRRSLNAWEQAVSWASAWAAACGAPRSCSSVSRGSGRNRCCFPCFFWPRLPGSPRFGSSSGSGHGILCTSAGRLPPWPYSPQPRSCSSGSTTCATRSSRRLSTTPCSTISACPARICSKAGSCPLLRTPTPASRPCRRCSMPGP